MFQNTFLEKINDYDVNAGFLLNKDYTRNTGYMLEDYKTISINNRRYLGNKYKLLDFIKSVVFSECKNIKTVADIFAGTGAVSSAFIDKQIITNDNMYSNYICHIAWFLQIWSCSS